MPRILVLILMVLTLAACGGGGGGGDSGGSGGSGSGGGGGGGGPTSPTNVAPTVTTTSFNVNQDTDLTATITATDPENDALTFAKTGDAAHGTVIAFQSNGAFTYRPTAGYKGADSFTITVSDGGTTVSATINITVNSTSGANHAPTAANDVVTVTAATPIVDVLANDNDPDGDTLTITVTEAASVGTAVVENGKVRLSALPNGFKGFTRFKYSVADAGGLSASATAAVFVDTTAIRLVYQTNEENFAQNLYVDDLTGPKRVSALTQATVTFLGRSNVSTNGRTIVWEEATGDHDYTSPNYHAQTIWTIPADLSSPARQISPDLQAGEALSVRSPLSADGKWVVYGVTPSGGGVEKLYLANLLPGGSSVEIPKPANTTRIESVDQTLLIGPMSQYVYFTATVDLGGATSGQATYRVPVADVTAPVRLSLPVVDRKSAVRLIASDESFVVQISADAAAIPSIERINTAAPGTEIALSHAGLVAGDTIVRLNGNDSVSTIAYIVQKTGPTTFDLYYAITANASSGTLVANIPADFAGTPPAIHALTANGDAALVSSVIAVGGNPSNPEERLAEISLSASPVATNVVANVPGLNMYTYIDNTQSIAFTSSTGVQIAPRTAPAPIVPVVPAPFAMPTVAYEFSADNQLFAAISDDFYLFLVNRNGGSTPLQITGLSEPSSVTQSVRVVPAN